MAAIALCYAGLCCEGLEKTLRRATRLLVRELDRQILADGGHASRNPRILVELLFDLLPLRQMYASREIDTPESCSTPSTACCPWCACSGTGTALLPFQRHGRHGRRSSGDAPDL